VENFRSVVDSGWIEAERVTSLIGVNESGKTNLLLPLWKLNPAHEGEIRPTSDYPKSNFAEIRQAPQKFWFIHTQFDIVELAATVASLAYHARARVARVYIAKNFRGDVWVDFPDAKRPTTISKSDLLSQTNAAATEIVAMTALAKPTPQLPSSCS